MKPLLSLLSVALLVTAAHAVPVNDQFVNATVLPDNVATGAKGTADGQNVGATLDLPDEADLPHVVSYAAANTVWFTYVAPYDGTLIIDSQGSSFDTDLYAYTGTSLSDLSTAYATGNTHANGTDAVTFSVQKGLRYYLAVYGNQRASGNIHLAYELRPVNDDYNASINVTGSDVFGDYFGTLSQQTLNATKENGEPNHAGKPGGHSVWLDWYSPDRGESIVFDTFGSDFNTVLAVYDFSAPGAYALVTQNDDATGALGTASRVSFTPPPGYQHYKIAVDGVAGATGEVVFSAYTTTSNGVFRWKSRAVSGPENGGSIAVTVYRVQGSAGTVTVDYDTGNGTDGDASLDATAPSDYTSTSGTLTFLNGEVSKTILIPVINDSIPENDESLEITLSNPTGGAAIDSTITGAETATVTIVNDDHPANDNLANAVNLGSFGTVSGAASVSNANNFGASLETGEPSGGVGAHSLWYQFTATSGGVIRVSTSGDYSHPAVLVYSGTSVGQLSAVSAQEVAHSNTASLSTTTTFAAVAGTTYRLQLDSLDTTGTGTAGFTFGYITPGTFSIPASASVAENVASGSVTINVTRTGGSQGAVSVQYATLSGTTLNAALPTSDFTPVSGTLNFADGETSKPVLINILNDTLPEGDESFPLVLSQPTGLAALGNATCSITIIDDEHPGTFSLASAAVTVSEKAGTLLLSVNRTNGSDGTAMVSFSASSGSALSGADFGLPTNPGPYSGSVTFNPGETTRTISIPLINDLRFELDEDFSVSLISTSIGQIGAPGSTLVTVTSDDLFIPVSGTYAVVLGAGNPPAQEGFLKLTTVNGKSALSGKLTLGGAAYSFKSGNNAGVNGQGAVDITILRKSLSPLSLHFQFSDGGDSVAVSLTDPTANTGFILSGEGGRDVYSSKSNPIDPALVGKYTFLLENATGTGIAPGGIGYAAGAIGKKGTLGLVGKLGDGSTFSIGTYLTKANQFAFQVPLYKKKGYLAGSVALDNQGFNGTVAWQKPAGLPKEKLYADGFALAVQLLGAKYIPPAKGSQARVLSGLDASNGNADLTFEGDFSFVQPINVTVQNKLAPLTANPARIVLSLVPATGLFKGSFTPPGGKKIAFGGALLQLGAGTGGGVFLETGDTGSVSLTP